MGALRTKSLENIERTMERTDVNSFRYQVLQSAKNFKMSWIDLGRLLHSVWKERMYKEWGYGTMEAYTAREIGIKKATAMKLLKSYYFLEQEEPMYLKKDYSESVKTAAVPSYDAINLLRLAKSKKTIDGQDYDNLKKDIFEKGKEASQIKRDLTALMRQREELDPDEAREKRKVAKVKRFLGILKALKQEIEISKLVSSSVIKDVATLIDKLESEIA